jgi:hypothetical protein
MRTITLIAATGLLALAGCDDFQQKPSAPVINPQVIGGIEAPAATPSSPGAELSPTDPARPAIEAVTDAAVVRSLGVPARVTVEILRAETAGDIQWAFVSGPAVAPDGGALDLSKTTMAQAAAEGMMDGTNVIALLKRDNGGWTVVTMAIGPTDVPQVGWPQQYGVSPALVGQEEAEGGE